jgi:4-hydroxy-tetrahydrodipicolinate synthase
LLYTNPDRTGVKISAALLSRLAQIDNIVGMKDSSGDLALAQEI